MVRRIILTGVFALAIAVVPVANAEVSIVDNVSGAWIDISGSGTALNLSDDGEVNITTTVGNALLGAGTTRVGSNGAVRFAGTGLSLSFSNYPIPSNNMFSGHQSLAPFWDDINTASGTNGNIYWEELGGDTLVVSWVGVDFFGGGTDAVDFQLQVHRTGTGNGFAQFLYLDSIEGGRADGGGSATIGYQAGGIENDVQWSYNTSGSVDGTTVLTLVPEPGSLALLGLGGLALLRRRRA